MFPKNAVASFLWLNVIQEDFCLNCWSWKRRSLLSFETSGPTHPATRGSHHRNFKCLVPAYIFQKYVMQSSSGITFLGGFPIIILYPFVQIPKRLILDKPTNSENCSNLLSLPSSQFQIFFLIFSSPTLSMCMLILISHHLPDTHKRDVRVKILCVLNTPPRHNVVWGVKEYYLAVFIPTEKVKNSQLHAKAVYSQGKKSHCVLGGSQNRSGSSGRRKKNIFFLRRIKSGYSSHQFVATILTGLFWFYSYT